MKHVGTAYRLALVCSTSIAAVASHAQCTDNNTLTGSAITPPCPGSTTVPCVQGGQYALVNVVAGNIYTFSTCGASFDTQITIFNNTGGASLGYNDDGLPCGLLSLQSSLTWTATYSGQLRVLVDQYNCVNNTTCAPLVIQCSAPPPPVTNDNPCTSIAVAVNTSCNFQTFSNVGATATAGAPAPSCGFYTGSDIWFTFVAPASGIVNIETAAGSMTDATFTVYSAPSCSGPFTEIACDDDSGPGFMPTANLTGLTPGQTYYLRVFGYLGATGTFSLCLHTLAVPAGDCVYILQMFDGYGDGWDGSTVGISINGGPFTTYTITGAYGFALIGLNIGQTIVVQYTAAGIFQGEISYTLGFLGGTGVFSSGSPPATGIVFTQTIDCNPPPAPQEDCLGSVTICGGQTFNNNTNNTGFDADLNTSNYGCLAAAEIQGTWYTWSPSSGGQVGFTIDPLGPDDYDFAIWGPYPTGSTTATMCPPVGPPIRCSFASGPSTFAATGDYNTGIGSAIYSPPQWANPTPAYSEAPGGDGWVSGLNVTAGQVYLMYISNYDESGLAFNLSWNLQGGASLDCTVLPIELLSFTATAMPDRVALKWATGSEIMSDHFVVERSGDGLAPVPIGQVDAAGSSVQHLDYAFEVLAPLFGMNYYRLRQVDTDGGSEHSGTVSAYFQNGTHIGDPYPIPACEQVALNIVVGQGMRVQVAVHDPLGRKLAEQTVSANGQGPAIVRFDCAQWIPGIYSMEARAADGCLLKATRWIKQ